MHRLSFRRYLRALERLASLGRDPPERLLIKLQVAWGNGGWAGDRTFLDAVFRWAARTQGDVLECGSGLSTLIAAAGLRDGRTVVALEHLESWRSTVVAATPRRMSARVSVLHAPIVGRGECDWYDVGALSSSQQFGLVICDGPPADTRGGRSGLVDAIRSRLGTGAVILLDDTNREAERATARRWCEMLPATIVEEGGSFVALRVD